MRNLLQSMSGVQLRLLWDRNIFIVLMNVDGVADAALVVASTDADGTASAYVPFRVHRRHDNLLCKINFYTAPFSRYRFISRLVKTTDVRATNVSTTLQHRRKVSPPNSNFLPMKSQMKPTAEHHWPTKVDGNPARVDSINPTDKDNVSLGGLAHLLTGQCENKREKHLIFKGNSKIIITKWRRFAGKGSSDRATAT